MLKDSNWCWLENLNSLALTFDFILHNIHYAKLNKRIETALRNKKAPFGASSFIESGLSNNLPNTLRQLRL